MTRAVRNANPKEISPVLSWLSAKHALAERVHLLPLLYTIKVSTSMEKRDTGVLLRLRD